MTRLPGPARHGCPLCGWAGPRFGPFLAMPEYVRSDAACPRCGALERHRAVGSLLKEEIAALKAAVGRPLDVLHVTPEPALASVIAPNARRYDRSQFDVEALQPHEIRVDLCDTGLPDESYDLIVANGILSCVGDVPAALSEVRRVLRPGGVFVAHEHVEEGRTRELPPLRPGDPIRPAGLRRVFGREDLRLLARGLDVRHVDLGKRFSAGERVYYGLDSPGVSAGMSGLLIRKPADA